MAGTQWFTHYTLDDRRSFLLTDGTVVQEPALEESKSGIKVRLRGDRTTSFYKRDKEKCVRHGLDKVAEKAKAQLWMPVDLDGSALEAELEYDPDTKSAVFDPAQPINGNNLERSVAWWSFKHPTMPIRAVLSVRLAKAMISGTENYAVHTKVVFANTKQNPDSLWPDAIEELNSAMPRTKAVSDEWEAFLRNNPADWTDMLGIGERLNERRAVEVLVRKVRRGEGLDTLSIPDLRDGGPAWLDLEFDDTNVTGRYLSDLKEYLEGTNGVDRAVEIYQELVDCMRGIGMILDTTLTGNDFMQALLTGDHSALVVHLGPATTDDDSEDDEHLVSVHLPTGTFVVTCTNDRDDKVAHDWDEAVLLSELTGKKDALLAYADAHDRAEHTRRTKLTIGRRLSATD